MKFDIKKSIDSTINYFKTRKRVIFPVFMEEKDKEAMSCIFSKLNDYYANSVGNDKDKIEYKKLSNELETLRLKLIKKYKENQ